MSSPPTIHNWLIRNGTALVTRRTDGATQLWDFPAALTQSVPQPRATLYTFENDAWLITTPAGYFDCSPEVRQAIRWKQDGSSSLRAVRKNLSSARPRTSRHEISMISRGWGLPSPPKLVPINQYR